MPLYICNGAKLMCSMGSAQSELGIIHPAEQSYLHGQNIANIMDHQPMMNIRPFGLCSSLANPAVAAATAAALGVLTPMPCMPNTISPWMPGNSNVFVRKQPALMNDCKLNCMWAGTIEIIDHGQM